MPARCRSGEDALLPVIALVMMLPILSMSGVMAFVWVSGIAEHQERPPLLSFYVSADECAARLVLVQAGGGNWRDLVIRAERPDVGGITAAGRYAAGPEWRGDSTSADRPLEAGDDIHIALRQNPGDVAVGILHEPTGTLVFQRDVAVPKADAAPPTAGADLTEGAIVTSLASIPGSAQDSCSGLGEVRVALQRVSDGLYLRPDGTLDATPSHFATQGASWRVDLPASQLAAGQYLVVTTATDVAGNPSANHTVTVVLSPNGPQADPGHAFEDIDNDGRYTEGLDILIPDADVRDGRYEVANQAHGLVLPPGLGDIGISAGGIDFESGQHGHLVIQVNLTASSGLELEGGTDLQVKGVRLESTSDKVLLESKGKVTASALWARAPRDVIVDAKGHVDLNRSTLNSTAQKVDVKVTGPTGDVWLEDADVRAWSTVDLDAKGDLNADRAKLTSVAGSIDLDADRGSSGDVSLRSATLTAKGEIDIDAKGHIRATGATLHSSDDNLDLHVSGSAGDIDLTGSTLYALQEVQVTSKGSIFANSTSITSFQDKLDLDSDQGARGSSWFRGATLSAHKDVDLDAKDDMDLGAASVTSTHQKVDLDTQGGALAASDATVSAHTYVELTAATTLTADRATLTATNNKVDVDANGGAAGLAGARLTAHDDVLVDAAGNIDVGGATLRSTHDDVELDAKSGSRTITVQGATFDDRNDRAKAKPSGVTISGAPASGAIDHTG